MDLADQPEPEPVRIDCDHCLERLKSRLLVDLSHEFRTPLTLILGPLSDLRSGRNGELSAAAHEQLDLARRSAERLQGMVTQILDTAGLESGRLELHVQRVDLGELLAGLAEDFRDLAERRGLELDFEPPAAPLPLTCDPDQLVKIVSNLLANALRYSPNGDRVRLEVEATGDNVTVIVRDQGPSVPAEDRERIFDRYYRAAQRCHAGTGLGLPLARQLAELHGGSLTLDSPPGQGTTFRVELPRGHEPAQIAAEGVGNAGILPAPLKPSTDKTNGTVPKARAHAGSASILPAPAKPSTHKANGTAPKARAAGARPASPAAGPDQTTVLVVDDDRDIRTFLRAHLEPRYRVEEATDGADGLLRARDLLPDLVVSDVMMPDLDGHGLCRALKQDPELDWIPILLLTARAALDDKLDGLGVGADAYLTKPFDARELSARVDNLIDSRRRLRQSFAAGNGGGNSRPPLPLAPGVRPENGDRAWFEQVRQAVDTGLDEDAFTVEDLAGRLATHRTQLFRRLRQLTGLSPAKLIRRRRLERASVSEAAYAAGFRNAGNFSRRFSEHYGQSPSTWRKSGALPSRVAGGVHVESAT